METKKFKCKNCNYEWISRVEEPKTCPKCKRYDWKKKL
jgi:predicted Zn-ribbon and HTH transcriptional regulator